MRCADGANHSVLHGARRNSEWFQEEPKEFGRGRVNIPTLRPGHEALIPSCISTILAFAMICGLGFPASAQIGGGWTKTITRGTPSLSRLNLVSGDCGRTSETACFDDGYQLCPPESGTSNHYCFNDGIDFVLSSWLTYDSPHIDEIQPPTGVQLDSITIVDENGDPTTTMWGCGNGSYSYELHFSTFGMPHEGPFRLSVQFSGTYMHPNNPTPGSTFDTFEGEILLKSGKIVVVLDPPPADPDEPHPSDFEDTICFFEELSDFVDAPFVDGICEDIRLLSDPLGGLDMSVTIDSNNEVDPATITKYDIRVFKENERSVTVNELFVRPIWGKVLSNNGPYSIIWKDNLYNDLPTAGLTVNTPLERFNSASGVGEESLYFQLLFGANDGFFYQQGEASEHLYFDLDDNCLDSDLPKQLDLNGEVYQTADLKFERIFDSGLEVDITGTPHVVNRTFPSSTKNILIRVSYLDDTGSFFGTLGLENLTDHGHEFDFSFAPEDILLEEFIDISSEDRHQLVTIYLRTNEWETENYEARFDIIDLNQHAFTLEATTGAAIEVLHSVNRDGLLNGNGQPVNSSMVFPFEINHQPDYDTGLPNQPNHDYFTVTNMSDSSVELSGLAFMVTSGGYGVLGGDGWIGGTEVLEPEERVEFQVDTSSATCEDLLSGNVSFDYSIGLALQKTFDFDIWISDPCWDWDSGFELGIPEGPPPIGS